MGVAGWCEGDGCGGQGLRRCKRSLGMSHWSGRYRRAGRAASPISRCARSGWQVVPAASMRSACYGRRPGCHRRVLRRSRRHEGLPQAGFTSSAYGLPAGALDIPGYSSQTRGQERTMPACDSVALQARAATAPRPRQAAARARWVRVQCSSESTGANNRGSAWSPAAATKQHGTLTCMHSQPPQQPHSLNPAPALAARLAPAGCPGQAQVCV